MLIVSQHGVFAQRSRQRLEQSYPEPTYPGPTYTRRVSPARKIFVYSLIRIVLFAVPFAILMFLNISWWFSAIVAATVAACLSYLLLSRQRDEVAMTVSSWRKGERRDEDNDVENEAIDRQLGGTRRENR